MAALDKIRGINFGNWLVLEKWISPDAFGDSPEEDETWLARTLPPEELQERMTRHRTSYITEEDFRLVAQHGYNLVRLPVPYFVFGDRPPFLGCVDCLDKAFTWAERTERLRQRRPGGGVQVAQGPRRGEFCPLGAGAAGPAVRHAAGALRHRGAQRAHQLPGLPHLRHHRQGQGQAGGQGARVCAHVFPQGVLPTCLPHPAGGAAGRQGHCLPRRLPPFPLEGLFRREGMENVLLDTHIYLFAMEFFLPVSFPWIYRLYVALEKRKIQKAARWTPVVVGEWCIECRYPFDRADRKGRSDAEKQAIRRQEYRRVAALQRQAWETSQGWIYWTYQMDRDPDGPMRLNQFGHKCMEAWSMRRLWKHGWWPEESDAQS